MQEASLIKTYLLIALMLMCLGRFFKKKVVKSEHSIASPSIRFNITLFGLVYLIFILIIFDLSLKSSNALFIYPSNLLLFLDVIILFAAMLIIIL